MTQSFPLLFKNDLATRFLVMDFDIKFGKILFFAIG